MLEADTGPPAGGAGSLAGILYRCSRFLGTERDYFASYAKRLRKLSDRLERGRFHLAVLGQFKRGKSTLLNALLGIELLPTGVVPLTSIPTFIRYGESTSVVVSFIDGRRSENRFDDQGIAGARELLSAVVTEKSNPGNDRGVSSVEVTVSSDLLADGIVLVDTPGIGSTFRHNTDTTMEVLPECDAGLFMVSADPPITDVEAVFLEDLARRLPRIFFVMNKVDYLDDEQKEEALAFLQQVLTGRLGLSPGNCRIYCVSAARGLKARLERDDGGWRDSGMLELERELVRFRAREKSKVLRDAVADKAARILNEVLMRLDFEARAYKLPLEELENRLVLFDEKIAHIERRKSEEADLLRAEAERMLGWLDELSGNLHSRAVAELSSVLESVLSPNVGDSAEFDEAALREELSRTVPSLFEGLYREASSEVDQRMKKILGGRGERVSALMEELRRTAADLFEVDYRAPDSETAFTVVRRPYWVTGEWKATIEDIAGGAFERLLPSHIRHERRKARLDSHIDSLVCQNVENIRWALYQSVNESFRRFARKLDEGLADVLQATRGAMVDGIETRHRKAARVKAELERIEGWTSSLQSMLDDLAAFNDQGRKLTLPSDVTEQDEGRWIST